VTFLALCRDWRGESQFQSESLYVYVSQSLLSHYNFFLAAFPAFPDPLSFLGRLPDSLGVSSLESVCQLVSTSEAKVPGKLGK